MAGAWAVCLGEEDGIVQVRISCSSVCLSIFLVLFVVCFLGARSLQRDGVGLGVPTQVWRWSSTCVIRWVVLVFGVCVGSEYEQDHGEVSIHGKADHVRPDRPSAKPASHREKR